MGWLEFLLGVATLVLGTGWLFTWKAYKRKNNGEATQAEAEGWSKMQEVYKKTIDDLNAICDEIREDRNHLRDDRNFLRKENEELRAKYNEMENEIMSLKKDLARQGRKIEALSPFLCGVVGCVNRTKVDLQEQIPNEENE